MNCIVTSRNERAEIAAVRLRRSFFFHFQHSLQYVTYSLTCKDRKQNKSSVYIIEIISALRMCVW
jgi:hypothetical protein